MRPWLTGRQQLRQHPHTFSSSTKSLAKAQTPHTDWSACRCIVLYWHHNISCGWLCAGARPYLSLSEAGHPTPADAADTGAAGYERQVSGYSGNAMLSPTSTAPMTARSIQGGTDYRRCAPTLHSQGLQEKQLTRLLYGTFSCAATSLHEQDTFGSTIRVVHASSCCPWWATVRGRKHLCDHPCPCWHLLHKQQALLLHMTLYLQPCSNHAEQQHTA